MLYLLVPISKLSAQMNVKFQVGNPLFKTKDDKAMKIFDRVHTSGGRPSVSVILAALKACSSACDLENGRRIHEAVVASGDRENIFVASTLVDMFAKCGSMEDARRVFESMQRRNAVAWNCMIMGYASRSSTAETALQLYSRMQHEDGLRPNRVTFLAALKACVRLAEKEQEQKVNGKALKLVSLNKGKKIHLEATKAGDDAHVFVGNALIDMYCKCGSLEDAKEVFDSLKQRTVVSWNSIILGYAENGQGRLALEMYSRMEKEWAPDSVTVIAALKACSSLVSQEGCADEALQVGKSIHRLADERGLLSQVSVASSIVDMYSKCKSLKDASAVFESMPSSSRSQVSWTSMVMALAEDGQGEAALQMFSRMQSEGYAPDHVTYIALLKACMKLADNETGEFVKRRLVKVDALSKGKGVHCEAVRRVPNDEEDRSGAGCSLHIFVSNALVEMYSKCGSIINACLVFESMQFHSLVSWNCIILACGENGEGSLGMQLYRLMHDEGRFAPNAITYVGALKACGSSAALELGRKLVTKISATGLFQTDPSLLNSLVDFYSKCGSLGEARQVFESMSRDRRDLVTWNSLMDGYSRCGDTRTVFELLNRMQEEQVEADEVTLLIVLSACGHAGEVERGVESFQGISSRFGKVPTKRHYECLVDMLGRSNRLDEAVGIATQLDSFTMWMTLLSGCHKWKNLEIGKVAFSRIASAESPQAFVLMSNIYKTCTDIKLDD